MRKEKIPLTRKNYIALTYLGELPDDWTRANEADLPAELQASFFNTVQCVPQLCGGTFCGRGRIIELMGKTC